MVVEYKRSVISVESIPFLLRKISKHVRRDYRHLKKLINEALNKSDRPIDVNALEQGLEEFFHELERVKQLQAHELYKEGVTFENIIDRFVKQHVLNGLKEKEHGHAIRKILDIIDYTNKELEEEKRDQRRLAHHKGPRMSIIGRILKNPKKIARRNIKDANMLDYLKKQEQDLYSQTLHAFSYTASKTDHQESISEEEYHHAVQLIYQLFHAIKEELTYLNEIEKDTVILEYDIKKLLDKLKKSARIDVKEIVEHLLAEYEQQQDEDLATRKKFDRREGMSRREFVKKLGIATAGATMLPGAAANAMTTAEKLDIRDDYSPTNDGRPMRKSTQYIILHTTLDSMRTKTNNKDSASRNSVWRDGSCNYLVLSNGEIRRIIGRDKFARHAGYSMWNKQEQLSHHSIGIEIAGFENEMPTWQQKKSLKGLLSDLQRIYTIPDENVLPHCMIAYGPPNQWNTKSYRPRRKCAMRYADPGLRREIGLSKLPRTDPDVRAGRLAITSDPELASLYASIYKGAPFTPKKSTSNIITKDNTPWNIAGEDYDDEYTLYTYPNGTVQRGSDITNWAEIPEGTTVTFGDAESKREYRDRRFDQAPVFKQIGRDGDTLWQLVGNRYANTYTIYFYPDGRVFRGDEMEQEAIDHPAQGLRVVTDYVYGGKVGTGRMPLQICGRRWNTASTIYVMPGTRKLVLGNDIDERAIPKGTIVIFKR